MIISTFLDEFFLTLQIGQLLGRHNNGKHMLWTFRSCQIWIGDRAYIALAHLQVVQPDIQILTHWAHGVGNFPVGVMNIKIDMSLVYDHLACKMKVGVADVNVRLWWSRNLRKGIVLTFFIILVYIIILY